MIEAVENQGYCPDLAFQMDAETILSFEGTEGATPNINPFKVMFNQLSRGGYIAVGTKDKFAIMDEETGKPTNKPIRSAQLGYELTNTRDNLITLPGGALLSNTAYYLAGMSVIADKTPSNGVEDYTYTQLLRDRFERQGLSFDSAVKSISTIRHLNRTPENPNEALRQTGLWRTSALAVNRIFPEGEYNSEGIITYAALVLMQRIKMLTTKVHNTF